MHGKAVISGCMIQATIGATIFCAAFLSGRLDDSNSCEAGVISFPDGKTMSSQAAQELYEEFVKMNELTGSITLFSKAQARVSDKSLVDSLEGTVVWEYDSMA